MSRKKVVADESGDVVTAKIMQFQVTGVVQVLNSEGQVKDVTSGNATLMEAEFDKSLADIAREMEADFLKQKDSEHAN